MPMLDSLLALYPLEHVAVGALGLVIYVAMAHFGRQRRHPSAAIAWVVAIVSFPFVALPLFLLIGSRKFVRPAGEPHSVAAWPEGIAPAWASQLSNGLLLPPARLNSHVKVLEGGREALESLVRLTEQAQHRLDLCTFLFAGDEAGRRVADALVACAGRGCRVRVLLDAIGGRRAPREITRTLASAGVDVRRFTPLLPNFWKGTGNLRNHRKLAIADGARVWSGGRNIADEYFFDRPGHPAWKDLSFTVEGDLALDAVRLFERDWQLAGGIADAWMPASAPEGADRSGVAAQFIPSGPDQAADTLFEFLLNAIYQARTRILATTPYFVPDDALLQALVIACRRGVHFQLVIPARSNHRLADWTRDRSLRELAAAGAEILLLPDMSHAKLVVVDEALALCGSANLDGRSLFLNYELSTAFYGRDEIGRLADWHRAQADLARGYVAIRPSLTRDVFEGLVRAVGFQL